MLVGQQIGPFVIDKELGSGAMGTVYRGRYLKTGQLVAIKVMAPGLGTTNSRAAERFEREAEILKQFKHPNIVRLFGVGKTHGTRYFAMEYVDGESLDRVMARRGRMSWEEVVELGKQLCAALEHSHEKGIIHRDLKPSNLMVLGDGTVKLTDFGIAKDPDATALTSANCTVGTAAYMSPEQCKGERDLSHKSDLYSMGVVFYELITGRKPFNADNAMEMFMQHVQGTFERPSRIVLEVPVWLDHLICALLNKKPEDRPTDAKMIGDILAGIREKVEAQKSAGVEAASAKRKDLPEGMGPADEEDRRAARFLLKGKVRGKRKKKEKALLAIAQAAGILLLLAGLLTTLYLVLKPATPEQLYAQAAKLMASSNPEDHEKALQGPLTQFRNRYGSRDDEQARQMQEWFEDLQTRESEEKLVKHVRKGSKFQPQKEEGEETPFAAAMMEDTGDLEGARKKWVDVEQNGMGYWPIVARRHIARIDAATAQIAKLEEHRRFMRDRAKEVALKDDWQQQAYGALRADKFGDKLRAKVRYEALKSRAAESPSTRVWQLFASGQIAKVEEKLKDNVQTDASRKDLVREKLSQAKKDTSELDAAQTYLDIIALYSEDTDVPALKEAVEEARQLLVKITGKRSP